jgi:hypothetical protein
MTPLQQRNRCVFYVFLIYISIYLSFFMYRSNVVHDENVLYYCSYSYLLFYFFQPKNGSDSYSCRHVMG